MVNLGRTAAALLLGAALLVACSGGSEEGGRERAPDDAPPRIDPQAALSCDRVASAVDDEKRAAKAQHDACARDEDCALTGFATACAGSCGTAVSRESEASFRAALSAISARHCSAEHLDACGYATPYCLQGAAACREGRCETVAAEATAPDVPDAP